MLDGELQPLRLQRIESGRSSAMLRVPLAKGRSGVLAVSERARWISFESNGAEVARRALKLVPGEVTTVRY